jgi:precorrin-3B synthase
LADAALRCGNGVIGLSARANLHLRGLSVRTLPDLHARLEKAGLIDADPEVERLRNIIASSLDDVDPEASFDLGPSVAALETRLREDDHLRRLPPKFSFVLDAKGSLPLGDVDADIRFDVVGGESFAVYLAGEDALAAECAPDAVVDVAARLANAFLALAGEGEGAPRRMRALVEREGAEAIFANTALRPRPCNRPRRSPALRDVMGAHLYGAEFVVGAGAAFGEIDAARLKALIKRARSAGASGLRLTPWRAFLLAGLDRRSAESLVDAIAELGFIVDAGDLRLRVAACPGAPACAQGCSPVRADATRWAPMLPKGDGVVLHVSGCAKGCARPTTTAVTVTATTRGYDLILGGRAGDPPIRRSLTRAEVAQLLAHEGANPFAGAGPT